MTGAAAETFDERDPLTPGRPAPLPGFVRGSGSGRGLARIPTWLRVVVAIGATLALGTDGYLNLSRHYSFLQSLYAALKLYTLDLGPASPADPSRPNWQIWVALILAAALLARGALALGRDRLRRWSVSRLLSGHVVVCGAGVFGTQLVRDLSKEHDVVVVDINPLGQGLQELRGRYEWRLTGDAVSERTLLAAGVRRAHQLIAVTGDDFLNSQIVSAMRSLAAQGLARDRVHVLVQVDDPSLARFLGDDSDESSPAKGTGDPDVTPAGRPIITPFSANAIAAETLLDECQVRVDEGRTLAPLTSSGSVPDCNLLLVGDHPLLDAVVLAVVRRCRLRALREAETVEAQALAAKARGEKRGSAPDLPSHPPVHISFYGPDAERRVTELLNRWRPERGYLLLEGRNTRATGEVIEPDDWLRQAGRADHAIVACQEELDGIALTISISRELGDAARMTRVTTQFENALDVYLQDRSAHSLTLATTDVRSIVELGARPEHLDGLPPVERLTRALEQANADDAEGRARALLAHPRLAIRPDPTWRARPGERSLAQALLALEPPLRAVPLSALFAAGLRLDIESMDNLLLAARRLSARHDPTAITAWGEYVRAAGLSKHPPPSAPEGDVAAGQLLTLYAAILGDHAALDKLPQGGCDLARWPQVTILAGGAASLSPRAEAVLEPLLERALAGHRGVLLSGGTDVGVPGIVGRIARRRGLALVGYVPAGLGAGDLYATLRETHGADDFTVLEPLAMWTDIMRAGCDPAEVRLLACPGGTITHQEVTLARALGATVAWLDVAGEQSPLDDLLALGSEEVLELPADAMTVRAFVTPSRLSDELPEELREELRDLVGRYVHDDYRRSQRSRKAPGDAALAQWEDLPASLRASNLAQADDISNKLSLIGLRLDRPGEALTLSDDDVELLAEVEHGRWNVERIAAGWRLGPREIGRSTSPDLVPWDELPESIREYDREAVRNIPAALAAAEWGVARA